METPEIEAKEEVYTTGQFMREMVTILVLVLLVIIPIHTFLFQPFFVQGSSMEPNFRDGEYLIVRELGYKQTSVGLLGWNWFTVYPSRVFTRGEVVVFHPPQKDDVFYIKRVIGLPGETVQIVDGHPRIAGSAFPEGRTLDESAYLKTGVMTTGHEEITLGEDEYFVLGDNRSMSQDSRYFGPVKKDHITGKVILRAWPLSRSMVY
jgi:signal peptidase I